MNPKSLLFGVAVGDALGVPVEFKPRSYLEDNPVTDMICGGTHNQPAGTWSDDSSLTFCLADSLTKGFDLNDIATNIIKWRTEGYWTAHGHVFDVGCTTDEAINRLRRGVAPEKAGGTDVQSNGNGSLMRIAPLVFYLMDKPAEDRWDIVSKVSAITHNHIISKACCFYYLEFVRGLLTERDNFAAYGYANASFDSMCDNESEAFRRLLYDYIEEVPKSDIRSDGYVVHTLEASIWCLLTTDSYKEAVLKAVNLGYDTDTTGAVTGGLAGLLYGYDSIPEKCIEQLARKDDIADLAERMEKSFKISTRG